MLYPLQRAFTHGIAFDFQVALWKGRVGIANSNVSIAIGMEKGNLSGTDIGGEC